MNLTYTISIMIVSLLVLSSMTILPISAESRISIPAGTSVVGCEIVNECYIPAIVTATVGER
jgi:hypothetical protein